MAVKHPFWGSKRLGDELHADMLAGLTRRPPGAVVQVYYEPGGLFMGAYMFVDSLQAIEEDHPAASAAARVSEY